MIVKLNISNVNEAVIPRTKYRTHSKLAHLSIARLMPKVVLKLTSTIRLIRCTVALETTTCCQLKDFYAPCLLANEDLY